MAAGVLPPFPHVSHAALAPLTTLELGGPARALAEATSEEALASMLDWARSVGWPVLILGGGSNLVVGDGGFDGLVIRIALQGLLFEPTGRVEAAAGESWDMLVAETVTRGWCGFECLSGIPGSVGATPIQNVGAYGAEVAETITGVRVLERASGRFFDLDPASCAFAYRDSRFKQEPEAMALVSVRYRLDPRGRSKVRYAELAAELGDDPPTPARVRSAVLAVRRRKSMVADPQDANRRSVGSFFVNPTVDDAEAVRIAHLAVREGWAPDLDAVPRYPTSTPGRAKLSAAWLIERSGFMKGYRRGAVGLSSRHALALVHHGGGRTTDLLDLAAEVRDAVRERFGIVLIPEPSLVGCALPPPRSAA